MASHGKQRHLKRMASAKAAGLSKKTFVWTKKPAPGPHASKECIPLSLLLKEILNVASSNNEVKKLLIKHQVLVDGRFVSQTGFPVGLMDVTSIPAIGKHYRLVTVKGILRPVEITADQSKTKLCKIVDKTVVKQGKVQLEFHDGRTLLIEKEEDRFKPGDSLKISIPKQSIQGFLKLEKGATCLIYKGKHAGVLATLSHILEREGSKASDAVLSSNGKEYITLKEYLFVVDKEFKV